MIDRSFSSRALTCYRGPWEENGVTVALQDAAPLRLHLYDSNVAVPLRVSNLRARAEHNHAYGSLYQAFGDME